MYSGSYYHYPDFSIYPNLRKLDLRGNTLYQEDFENVVNVIKDLPNLDYFCFYNNNAPDMTSLTKLGNKESSIDLQIDVDTNSISDISWIENLDNNITYIDFQRNPLSNIESLINLKVNNPNSRLTKVCLKSNPISSEDLARLRNYYEVVY